MNADERRLGTAALPIGVHLRSSAAKFLLSAKHVLSLISMAHRIAARLQEFGVSTRPVRVPAPREQAHLNLHYFRSSEIHLGVPCAAATLEEARD
jgi:hypothetical protein